MIDTFEGVIVYEILPNGCMNGVYSNDHPRTKNQIFNEIIRKISELDSSKMELNFEKIDGIYSSSFMDFKKAWDCRLEITIGKPSEDVRCGQYNFKWYKKGKNGKAIFEGKGWLTRKNQITVLYRFIKS